MLQVVTLRDRYDDNLDRREFRRQYESVVVGVGHDEGTDESGRDTPRGSPYVLGLIILIQIGDLEGLGEVLSEEVGGTALQSLTILHHGLDGVGVEGTGETLGLTLHTLNHRYCHPLFSKLGIDLQHLLCFLFGFLTGGVSGVALLPEEL